MTIAERPRSSKFLRLGESKIIDREFSSMAHLLRLRYSKDFRADESATSAIYCGSVKHPYKSSLVRKYRPSSTILGIVMKALELAEHPEVLKVCKFVKKLDCTALRS